MKIDAAAYFLVLQYIVPHADWIISLINNNNVCFILMKFIDLLMYACVLQSKRIKIQCLWFIDERNTLFFSYILCVHRRPVSTSRVDGPSWRVSKNAPEFTSRQLGLWTRVVETDLNSEWLNATLNTVLCCQLSSVTMKRKHTPPATSQNSGLLKSRLKRWNLKYLTSSKTASK